MGTVKIKKQVIMLIKSILYRIYSSFITFLISYFITKQVSVGLFIGIADFVIKVFTYYIYEWIWDRIKLMKQLKTEQNGN
jgi:uncharacterized membrane protein